MFYATFKGIKDAEIAAFETEQDRNNWVNFKDNYSVLMGYTAEYALYERIPLNAEIAEERIPTMLHVKDEFNDNQEWYIARWCK